MNEKEKNGGENPIFDNNKNQIAIEHVFEVLTDIDLGEKVSPWLQKMFKDVALQAISDSTDILEKLTVKEVLPRRLTDFRDAHNEAGLPFSLLDLLVADYFATGLVAKGVTLADIKSYDPDLVDELRCHQEQYGKLPEELYIPRDQFDAPVSKKTTSFTVEVPSASKP